MISTITKHEAPRVHIKRAEVYLHGRTHESGGYESKTRAHSACVVIEDGAAVINGKGVYGRVVLALLPNADGSPEWNAREVYLYRDREDRTRVRGVLAEPTAAQRSAVRAAAVEMVEEFASTERLAKAEIDRLEAAANDARKKAEALRAKAHAIDARAMLFFKAAEVIAESGESTQLPQVTIQPLEI